MNLWMASHPYLHREFTDYLRHGVLTLIFPCTCRTRLVAVATQKFVADIASDALQYVNAVIFFLIVEVSLRCLFLSH